MLWRGKVARALELHVLDEVRQALLVLVFEHRTGLDDEPQLGPAGRLAVRPHVVAQAVRQRADSDFRVDRHLLRERIGRDRRGGGLAPGGRGLRGLRRRRRHPGGKDAGQDTADDADARVTHTSHPTGSAPAGGMERCRLQEFRPGRDVNSFAPGLV